MSSSRSRIDELRQRCARAIRGIARAHVKLVEKDPDDAAAALLQAHRFDRARFAGVGQLEIAGTQILDGLRLGVGHHDIEGDLFVSAVARWNAPSFGETTARPCENATSDATPIATPSRLISK